MAKTGAIKGPTRALKVAVLNPEATRSESQRRKRRARHNISRDQQGWDGKRGRGISIEGRRIGNGLYTFFDGAFEKLAMPEVPWKGGMKLDGNPSPTHDKKKEGTDE